MTNRRITTAAIGLLCLGAFVATPAARAEDSPAGRGITVTGSGQAKGKPTLVEIHGTVTGEAELAADAIVKYRDTKRRAVKAIEALKMKNLSIESNGYSVGQAVDPNQQMAMMQGRATTPGKQKVSVTEQLKIVLKDVQDQKPEELMDTVLKIVDAGRDGGLLIGPPPPRNWYEMQMQANNPQGATLVSFKIPDPAALREQAYKQAIDDAKKKANRLADLAGVKLGRVLSVQDGAPVQDQGQNAMMMIYGMPVRSNTEDDLTSGVFTDITVKINLTVQFEIAK